MSKSWNFDQEGEQVWCRTKKTGQVRVALAHEGFRTNYYKKPAKCESDSRTKGSVPLLSKKGKKITFVVWEPPLNINFILFLVFVVIAATEIHHL